MDNTHFIISGLFHIFKENIPPSLGIIYLPLIIDYLRTYLIYLHIHNNALFILTLPLKAILRK